MLISPNICEIIFLIFYKEMLTWWSSLPSTITSQFLWSNKDIKVDGKCFCFRDFSKKRLNFVGHLFD